MAKEKLSKLESPNPNKKAALDEALAKMKKHFGEGSVMRLGDNTAMQVETTPTGSLSLDLALGGGIPKGRIIEIFGPEASGKTTLTLHCIAESQKAGGTCAFIDVEFALDPNYARTLGVDIDNLYVSQPDSGEQALEIAETFVRSGAVDLIIVDSVAALTPRAEVEGEMGEQTIGQMARMMSQGCRKLAGSIGRSKSTVIFINQIREKIGVMYGSPETTSGGRALKFFSSVRMRVSRVEALKNGTEQVGARTKVAIVKNKIAPPFREVEFDLIYGKGISKYGDILDLAIKIDLIQKSGAWFTIGEERFQGRDTTKAYLEAHPEIAADYERQIREKLLSKNESSEIEEEEVEEGNFED